MKTKLLILLANILILLTIVFLGLTKNNFLKNTENNCTTDFVEKVYDGDTILTKKLGKIRILGIDTPEIYHEGWTEVKDYKFYACGEYGENEAKKYLLHKEVEICFDKNDNKTGGYNRILGYIFFTGDNNQKIDFGKMLIKKGFAKVYKNANFIYKKDYIKLEKEAKKNNLGIWTKECFEKDKNFKKLINSRK